jgi:hypothetical protein
MRERAVMGLALLMLAGGARAGHGASVLRYRQGVAPPPPARPQENAQPRPRRGTATAFPLPTARLIGNAPRVCPAPTFASPRHEPAHPNEGSHEHCATSLPQAVHPGGPGPVLRAGHLRSGGGYRILHASMVFSGRWRLWRRSGRGDLVRHGGQSLACRCSVPSRGWSASSRTTRRRAGRSRQPPWQWPWRPARPGSLRQRGGHHGLASLIMPRSSSLSGAFGWPTSCVFALSVVGGLLEGSGIRLGLEALGVKTGVVAKLRALGAYFLAGARFWLRGGVCRAGVRRPGLRTHFCFCPGLLAWGCWCSRLAAGSRHEPGGRARGAAGWGRPARRRAVARGRMRGPGPGAMGVVRPMCRRAERGLRPWSACCSTSAGLSLARGRVLDHRARAVHLRRRRGAHGPGAEGSGLSGLVPVPLGARPRGWHRGSFPWAPPWSATGVLMAGGTVLALSPGRFWAGWY